MEKARGIPGLFIYKIIFLENPELSPSSPPLCPESPAVRRGMAADGPSARCPEQNNGLAGRIIPDN